jgi:hypothetical protein
MRRRLPALLCALALCLTLLPAGAGAAGTVYFTAVNDRILTLSADSMPMYSGGVLYVPYTVFDPNSSGINLGVSCSYSRKGNTMTIYNLRQMLVFDMNADNARNQNTGQTYSARAITRNGLVYVPLAFTCDFFGLGWSNTATEYGNLVRVTNASAVLGDADFIDAGSSWMAARLREYQQSLAASAPSAADPAPAASAAPAAPAVTPDPGSGTRVCLAFRCDTGEEAEAILDTLDAYGCHALFFLPTQVLAERDDLLRRIVGSGHGLGLLTTADDGAAALAELEAGSALLERILHTGARMALAVPGTEDALTQAGWLCWSAQVDGVPTAQGGDLSAQVLAAVARHTGTVRVTLDDSQTSAQALASILRQLSRDGYELHLAVETEL